ncbi:nucleotidyl transferase AbiEii/AbiGii toxin family protein [Salisaeta longa]|uniref:nucleotidyl transferase AbiEii/AbiGii toxin family protein n=1 Tax=Salisaeta longa TaxID=503170 RepID=UPI0003B39D34|nr:nucleotidyl transferase AbiEii/AbiGii toxin family protein [Salisaeta longa]
MSPTNVSQSVRDRLLNRSRESGESHQALLTRFALERLLYRIGASDVEDQFVLKGAYAFLVWQNDLHRPTKDLDLLGYGDPAQLEAIFQAVCQVDVPDDGVSFDPDSVEVAAIRDQETYGGVRVTLNAYVGNAHLPLQIDVGFGDAVHPTPQTTTFPTLLNFPAATLRTYPRETVIAEKLHGMVVFGIANSRMKDFYDVWYLSRTFAFDGSTLTKAIDATFECRATGLPERTPSALTEDFARDDRKQTQWKAFGKRTRLQAFEEDLRPVIDQIRRFLYRPLASLRTGDPFNQHWSPEGPWKPRS